MESALSVVAAAEYHAHGATIAFGAVCTVSMRKMKSGKDKVLPCPGLTSAAVQIRCSVDLVIPTEESGEAHYLSRVFPTCLRP